MTRPWRLLDDDKLPLGSSTSSCRLDAVQVCGLVHCCSIHIEKKYNINKTKVFILASHGYCRLVRTWDSSSKQLLQVVAEQQLVAGHFEARPEEEGSSDAVEHLIWQCVLAGGTPLRPHCLHVVACCFAACTSGLMLGGVSCPAVSAAV